MKPDTIKSCQLITLIYSIRLCSRTPYDRSTHTHTQFMNIRSQKSI